MVAEPRSGKEPRVRLLPRRWTVADYDALPDDGPRYELLDGVLIEKPSPTEFHQRVLLRLVRWLAALVDDQRAGFVYVAPLDVQLPGGSLLQPDIFFIGAGRRDILTDSRVDGAPDLVVEISSPSTRDRDLWAKRDAYLRGGVQEYWFVDLDERAVIVWQAKDGAWSAIPADEGGHARSEVLPGLTVDPVALFAE